MLFTRKRSETIDAIEIRGDDEFLLRSREALALLRSTSQFVLIQAHLGAIHQGRRSGMKAWAKRPTFIVGKATWQHSSIWYAGAIAHDSYHAKLYRDAKKKVSPKEPDANMWTGAEAEKKCLAFQRRVLLELNADEKTLAYIEDCAKNPAYHSRNCGWRSWLDYLRRWW